MKQAVIVTPFDNYSYNVRVKYLEKYLTNRGYKCQVISSDFDHRKKCRYETHRTNLKLIHVPEYRRNVSLSRIYSHYKFAKSVFFELENIKPDLVYGSAPPNFLIKFIGKYKRKNICSKVIFEIGDMWPETLPLSGKKKEIISPILNVWASIRNKNLKYSDAIVYECDLFKQKLDRYHLNVHSDTIYLCKEDCYGQEERINDVNQLNIAYVGSINNIIDIDCIIRILSGINKHRKVLFSIIGDGECKKELLANCQSNNISYIDYGILFDDNKKRDILKKCHFGLNIMKQSVRVGATMKSLEYFHWGLALINNIPADTQKIVDLYNCGVNIPLITADEIEKVTKIIVELSVEDIIRMKRESRIVFQKFFDEKAIEKKYEKLFDYVEND